MAKLIAITIILAIIIMAIIRLLKPLMPELALVDGVELDKKKPKKSYWPAVWLVLVFLGIIGLVLLTISR